MPSLKHAPFIATIVGAVTFGIGASLAAKPPIKVVVGKHIGGFELGMTLKAARSISTVPLKSEGIDRPAKTGWKAGPFLLLFDDQSGKAVTISLDLWRTGGIQIGDKTIPGNAKLAAIAKRLTHCVAGKGSGGNSLTCTAKNGKTLHFYDSYATDELWVMLP